MKLSDYVADFLASQGVRHVFVVSGGAAVHLVDSIARHPNIEYVCSQHEEGEAMAADAYARVTGNIGVGVATSGPGGTNLLTGVCCSYFDSVPTLFITGQVATFRLKPSVTMRQMGFQETDVESVFKSVTKYAVLIRDPISIRYHLEKAVYLARSGRPGPALIDLPDDLQRAEIDPQTLPSFTPPQAILSAKEADLKGAVEQIQSLLERSQRPVLVIGAGVHIAAVEEKIHELIERLQVPFLLTWGAMDIFSADHPLNVGGFGVCGPRPGNFTIQNADLIIGIGTRFSQMLTGGKLEHFGRAAKKVMIDIDAEELTKFNGRGLTFDLPIQADLRLLVPIWLGAALAYTPPAHSEWMGRIHNYQKQFPMCLPADYAKKEQVDANVFIDALSAVASEGDIVVTDAGGNLTWTMQGFKTKALQRLFSAWNHSPMGYSLAAAYGASFGAPGKNVICIIGDGGLQMCIEELATVARHGLPIKIFIFNNQGHGIQKQTIETWLESRYEALDHATGLYFPDFIKVAEAYGLPAGSITDHRGLQDQIRYILSLEGPFLCNVAITPNQRIRPMLTFGRPLEDQAPLLDRTILKRNMFIPLVPESLPDVQPVRS
jgi:acetolactate synthase I/II/III large subunit